MLLREQGRRVEAGNPVVWSHKTDTPDSVIGSADPNDVRETTSGLQVDGQLDINESSTARRAWQLLKSGAVGGWSFGYITRRQKRDKDGVNELFAVDLLELGPTLSPANPETATLAVKEAGVIRPRVTPEMEQEILAVVAEGKRREKAQRPIRVARFQVKWRG